GVRAQLRFRRGLERLSRHGVQVFVVHGNHDPCGGAWSAVQDWPEGVKVFADDRVEIVPVERAGERLAVVYGMSYARRDVTENLALRFMRQPGPGPHLALLHCNLGSDPDYPAYAPCTLEDLRQSGMDYWALGHVHQRRVVIEEEPWVVYPGNLQGRSPKASERGKKGPTLVRVEGGRIRSVQFEPVPHVRFVEYAIDIRGLDDIAAVIDAAERALDAERQEGRATGYVVRVRLTGRGALHADLQRPGTVEEIVRTLRDNAGDSTPFAWWAGMLDETRLEIDRDAILARGDFSAELVSLSSQLGGDPERLATLLATLVGDLDRHQATRFLDAGPPDGASLLSEAESLALDRLESEAE
ncbi:MAG: DNA repair exonuclease, partial [Acidobacteria bacterium]